MTVERSDFLYNCFSILQIFQRYGHTQLHALTLRNGKKYGHQMDAPCQGKQGNRNFKGQVWTVARRRFPPFMNTSRLGHIMPNGLTALSSTEKRQVSCKIGNV